MVDNPDVIILMMAVINQNNNTRLYRRERESKMDTIKEKMQKALRSHLLTDDNYNLTRYGYSLWTHFINGNWDGLDHFNVLSMRNASKGEQRSFVISRYTSLLSIEFNCSYGYAQKVIVGLFTKDKLASITNEFIDEMLNEVDDVITTLRG